MTVSVVDTATAAPTAGVTTFAASLVGATAPNALLWILGGDKNSGTITQPTDTPTMPIVLKGTSTAGPADQVTIALAHGTADGGETTISGTVGANIAGGQLWVAELADNVGTGAWARWGTVTNETDGADVTSVALTGLAATETGLAVAAVASDSVNTQGTVSWTSSTGHTFTARRSTASGGGQAGLWIATAPVTQGDTVSVTFARAGGTADQHSGFMTVFARTVASANTGVMAGAARPATGALTGTETTSGTMAGAATVATGALTATQRTTGFLAAVARPATGDAAAAIVDPATLAGTSPVPVGNLTGTQSTPGAFAAQAPRATGQLTGQLVFPIITGEFAALAAVAVGNITQVPAPPTDLPLRAGEPSLTATWRAGSPAIATGWRAGAPEVR